MSARVVLFVVLVLSGFQAKQWYQERQQQKAMSKAMLGDRSVAGVPQSCELKKFCITVYVAPCCPACKASQPAFFALQKFITKSRPDVGFGVIVGAGSAEENQEEVKLLSPIDGFADNSGVVMKSRGISGYPTWIVNDISGKEVYRISGGFQISSEEQIRQLVTQMGI